MAVEVSATQEVQYSSSTGVNGTLSRAATRRMGKKSFSLRLR